MAGAAPATHRTPCWEFFGGGSSCGPRGVSPGTPCPTLEPHPRGSVIVSPPFRGLVPVHAVDRQELRPPRTRNACLIPLQDPEKRPKHPRFRGLKRACKSPKWSSFSGILLTKYPYLSATPAPSVWTAVFSGMRHVPQSQRRANITYNISVKHRQEFCGSGTNFFVRREQPGRFCPTAPGHGVFRDAT